MDFDKEQPSSRSSQKRGRDDDSHKWTDYFKAWQSEYKDMWQEFEDPWAKYKKDKSSSSHHGDSDWKSQKGWYTEADYSGHSWNGR